MPPLPDADKAAEQDDGSERPSDAPVDRPLQPQSPSDPAVDAESTAMSVQGPPLGPTVEIVLDDVEHRSRGATVRNFADLTDELVRRPLTTEHRMLEVARAAERDRSTLERMAMKAGEEAQRNRSFVERYLGMATTSKALKRLADMDRDLKRLDFRGLGSIGWAKDVLDASEPIRRLSSSITEQVKTAQSATLSEEQVFKLAKLSIGVGQSLSAVLPTDRQSSVLKAVEELERFRASRLSRFLSPEPLKLDSVARFSPASLGFSSSVFSTIQKSTTGFGAAFSNAFADMERVAKAWEDWDRQMELHADHLGELGWTYPVNLTLPELRQLIQCTEAGELDKELVEFYKLNDGENFNEICDEILASDHLTPWHATLRECVQSHRDARFIVSATCLIVVLEGAITKEYGGRLKHNQLTTFFEQRIKEAGEDRFTAAAWRSMAGFMRNLFSYTDFSGTAPSRINRHWILRGKAVPTGSEADSLRLFQAIHTVSFIQDLLNQKRAN